MNYYQFHIGDFRSGTVNLSRLARWIYRDMLDVYYDTETPLPLDFDHLCDELGIEIEQEREVVRKVLRLKFIKEEDGYRHAVCDRAIAAYKDKQGDEEKRREHEQERQRRHRERRAELFAKLREFDIVPDYDTPTKKLQELLETAQSQRDQSSNTSDETITNEPVTRDTQVCTPDATAITINQEPITNNHKPEKEKRTYAPSARELALREQALGVLEYLNFKAERQFEPVDRNIKPILARLNGGATADDCKTVIDDKVRDWGASEKMVKHLKPETLFSVKFYGYLDDAKHPPKRPLAAQSHAGNHPTLGKAGQATALNAQRWLMEEENA